MDQLLDFKTGAAGFFSSSPNHFSAGEKVFEERPPWVIGKITIDQSAACAFRTSDRLAR